MLFFSDRLKLEKDFQEMLKDLLPEGVPIIKEEQKHPEEEDEA